MRREDETAAQSANCPSAITSIYWLVYQRCKTTHLRQWWSTYPARDNIAVAFTRSTIFTSVNTVSAAGAAARSCSPSNQDAAGAIATAPSGSQTRHIRTCLGVNDQIPSRHALLSRGQTVLRPVRRRCTRPIPFPSRIPAPALHLVRQGYIFRLLYAGRLLYPGGIAAATTRETRPAQIHLLLPPSLIWIYMTRNQG
jgi:hypothetical protein